MLVKDLRPRMAIEEIELEVVSKGEVREFANEKGSGKVCNCAAKDTDGTEVSMTLWNEQIDQVNEGDKVKIANGWTSEFRGDLQIGAGKKGTLEVLSE